MYSTMAKCLLCCLVGTTLVYLASGGSEIYADLAKIHGLLRTADDRLVQLSQRNCQSGSAFVELCPIAGNASFLGTLQCLTSNLINAPVGQVVEINFDQAFVTKPSVVVFTSGLTYAMGGSYNITVVRVTPTTLSVQVQVRYSPSTVRFTYLACDQQVVFSKAYLDITEKIAFYNES